MATTLKSLEEKLQAQLDILAKQVQEVSKEVEAKAWVHEVNNGVSRLCFCWDWSCEPVIHEVISVEEDVGDKYPYETENNYYENAVPISDELAEMFEKERDSLQVKS